jgi:hypothetical protein
MMRVLVLGVAALALSAASASADGYYQHHYGYPYGHATPVFEYTGNAYYGYPAPSYSRTSYPIYAAVPAYAAPKAYDYAPGCWGGCRY